LRAVWYHTDAHGAAARRKRPGDSNSRLRERRGNRNPALRSIAVLG
jgi:hypothetical protein